jgi:hypothetical protein
MPNNSFKSVNTVITTVNEVIYTAPPGFTTIVINAQLANTSELDVNCTFSYVESSSGSETNLIRDFRVRGNQSQSAIMGRLVINENDSIKCRSNIDAPIRLSLSLLETEDV